MRAHRAIVEWEPPTVRGKQSLPPTSVYRAASRFPQNAHEWPSGSWTVEVKFEVPPPEQINQTISQGTIRFMMEDAPHERLHEGATCELFEGLLRVARVSVLE
jgi:hypothetical protein